MAARIDGVVPKIMASIDLAQEKAAFNFRANLVLEVSILSLLIDAGITTADSAIMRIRDMQDQMDGPLRREEVTSRIERAIALLRDPNSRYPTSYIEKKTVPKSKK